MSDDPFVQELHPAPRPEDAFLALCDRRDVIFFDSSRRQTSLGRYSFLAADPIAIESISRACLGVDPFDAISSKLASLSWRNAPELPPFQGGAAGLLGYELGGCWERLPTATWDELSLPVAVIGIYHWVLAWDHQQDRCWFICQPGLDQPSLDSARSPLDLLAEILHALACPSNTEALSPVPHHDLPGAQFPLEDYAGVVSNFDKPGYLQAVQDVIDAICAGEIFQANLSQRLLTRARCSAPRQYLKLRKTNSAPFAGYFSHDDWAVLSSSPERFLNVSNGTVLTRPIKGTRQRGLNPQADLYTRDELRESDKDRAENVMIVDLLRNDLSRVCQPGSIHVPELCMVEVYETVTHLVSEVRGRLQPGADFWDLLKATFPGGSITGAPKIRAMEIITQLERSARGAYCGSLFYCCPDGTADSNILIRTMTQRFGWWQFPVGGGITAQSDPLAEYEETLHKARGILRSLDE